MSSTPPRASAFSLLRRFTAMFVRPHLKMLLLAFVFMLMAAGLTAAMAKFMQPMIDEIFTQKRPERLYPVALGIFFVFFGRGIVTYIHAVIMNKIGQKTISDVNRALFAHLIYADQAYLHAHASGTLISRFLSDAAQMRSSTVDCINGIRNSITVAALVGMMFWQDWKLSLIAIFVFPAVGFIVAKVGRRLRKMAHAAQAQTGDLAAALTQAFQGSKHVKSSTAEEFERARVDGVITGIYKVVTRAFRMSAAVSPFGELVAAIAIVTIIVYGGHQVIDGAMTSGQLFSFITAFLLAFDPMKRLANLNSTMQATLAAIERLFRVLDEKPQITDAPDAADLKIGKGEIVFDNVSFAYADGAEALRGVSFTAKGGQMVALVGASGAGKSTILSLLPRFYDVTSGAVRVDGQDVRSVTMKSLRRNLALVTQEIAVFNDSIRDNIAYGTPGATDEQVVEAAKAAQAHDFILELPEGYQTRIGEMGVKLSGGQRQRISIARAMLKNAPILLLDEATSALDATAERQVQAALERLQKGKTTLVVAHRLSTIINADVIHVLEDGRIVESGTHEELLAKGQAYARLYGTLLRESA